MRSALRADCSRCFALCCVAPAFVASADFAIDKPAGRPCPNLRPDFRCAIHDRLRPSGFPGCAAYDCFGAGQQVAQVTFGGRDWRRTPEIAADMFAAFEKMRVLHELLWYLAEALTLPAAQSLHGPLRAALEETTHLTQASAGDLIQLDVDRHREQINALLRRTSALVRAKVHVPEADFRSADLIGKNLRGADLRGADLRGAYLIGADLRGADLTMADVTGADLRAANLGGADLSRTVFLTQFQVNAATGDAGTRLPSCLARPQHWQA